MIYHYGGPYIELKTYVRKSTDYYIGCPDCQNPDPGENCYICGKRTEKIWYTAIDYSWKERLDAVIKEFLEDTPLLWVLTEPVESSDEDFRWVALIPTMPGLGRFFNPLEPRVFRFLPSMQLVECGAFNDKYSSVRKSLEREFGERNLKLRIGYIVYER